MNGGFLGYARSQAGHGGNHCLSRMVVLAMMGLATGYRPVWAARSGPQGASRALTFAAALRLSVEKAPSIQEAEGALTQAHGQRRP